MYFSFVQKNNPLRSPDFLFLLEFRWELFLRIMPYIFSRDQLNRMRISHQRGRNSYQVWLLFFSSIRDWRLSEKDRFNFLSLRFCFLKEVWRSIITGDTNLSMPMSYRENVWYSKNRVLIDESEETNLE